MKKVFIYFCLVAVTSFIACSNEEESPYYYGPSNLPLPVYIEIIDKEGRNLLDADMEGNIRENAIKVLKGEKTYYVKDLDKAPWETKLAYIKDNTLILYLFIGNPDIKQVVEIDWKNDRKDTIELKREGNYWYFYLNGEKHIGKNPHWVTIVME